MSWLLAAIHRHAAAALRGRGGGGLAHVVRTAVQLLASPWAALRRGVASGGIRRLSKGEKREARFSRIKAGHRRKAERAREQRALAVSAERQAREEWLSTLSADERATAERERHDECIASRRAADDARAARAAEAARLSAALESGARVAIDCTYDTLMSAKEQKSLARQLCYAYAANRKLERPFALHVCGLGACTQLPLPAGFERWHVRTATEEACAHFARERVVYLTPDSLNVLDAIDERDVYVIGGLVDSCIKKRASLSRAERWGVRTARLPVHEHASACKPVLTINGVVDLLAALRETGDWRAAFQAVELAGRRPEQQPGRGRPPAADDGVGQAAGVAGPRDAGTSADTCDAPSDGRGHDAGVNA
ncbi:hypothetical protein KFE25_006642 [Diacronema lutheri]|uniref:tRNA (guanine(9)-N(1))-methyltransferase n=3 Tax=Diacronema lutheri TaxID=2081491 RepID=A0A8J5XY44_DIALT|nr:hypothetical protein KFE25_006642 [Diacronema lutheri]